MWHGAVPYLLTMGFIIRPGLGHSASQIGITVWAFELMTLATLPAQFMTHATLTGIPCPCLCTWQACSSLTPPPVAQHTVLAPCFFAAEYMAHLPEFDAAMTQRLEEATAAGEVLRFVGVVDVLVGVMLGLSHWV